MLTNLKIENVAVIEKANIFFEEGLNILTGETGAGKSIVIDSINAVLGERTSKDLVRSGETVAKVSAFFEDVSEGANTVLDELGIEKEPDNSLLITRTITSDSKSSCRINGQPITATMLKKIGRELITICGQHDSQHLLQSESHMSYIDNLTDCRSLLDEYRGFYDEMRSVQRELKKLQQNETDKQSRLDFLSYQITELENANIQVGEREGLLKEKKLASNREKIRSALYEANEILSGDNSSQTISDMLYSLEQALNTLTSYQEDFEPFLQSISSFRYELDDCSALLSNELLQIDENITDINDIEERLDVLYRLSQKYGRSEENILSYLENARQEYDSIAFSAERKQELQEKHSKLSKTVFNLGCNISDCRKTAALKFEQAVQEELASLNMPGAVFTVEFTDKDPCETGLDEVQFLFSANSGQEPRPLSKIASGGELSRVMLAIRCVLSDNDNDCTMIFDEIDSGVSGRAANKISKKLRQLSKGRQIICVTHLAQIACAADHHLLIEKNSENGKTYTNVTPLDNESRVEEIARIIGGDIITDATRQSARELIEL